MADELEERVMCFVSAQTGIRRERIKLTSDIFADLCVDGMDADELVDGLSKEFGFSQSGFRPDRHYGPELAFNPLALLLPSWWRWHTERMPLRIEHFVEAARSKRWPIDYSNEVGR